MLMAGRPQAAEAQQVVVAMPCAQRQVRGLRSSLRLQLLMSEGCPGSGPRHAAPSVQS